MLTEKFVRSYEGRKVDFGFKSGPNSIGELTFFRTYSRVMEDGQKEQWHQTVARVVNGIYKIQKGHAVVNGRHWNEAKARRSAEAMFDKIFNMKFLPPGRGLWMSGTKYVEERGAAALNNCFSGDTEILTEKGVQRLADLCDESVKVLADGELVKAEVKSFGVQSVNRVTFAPAEVTSRGSGYRKLRSNIRHDVTVTADHRWILVDGIETTELAIGDTVKASTGSFDGPEYYDGKRHGLIFGDGTYTHFTYANGERLYKIRMCEPRTQSQAELFERVANHKHDNGDPTGYVRSFDNLKELPLGKSPAYLRGFVEGWAIADAHEERSGSYCLDTQNADAAAWLVKNAPLAGMVVSGWNVESSDTNFGPRSAPLNRMTIKPEGYWKVSAIEEGVDKVEVFCPVVPDLNKFTLAAGIETGNCGFVSTSEKHGGLVEAACWLMDMSMLGVGVGFDTEGVGQKITAPFGSSWTFQVPDSREGWVESVRYLLESFLSKRGAEKSVFFDYSLIRPKGAPINGFGGVAEGPEPLIQLHNQLRSVLARAVMYKGYLTSRDIVDIMNMIGQCVVAGNVRRSAEIALGHWYDKEFINLKNYEQNPERGAFGWVSNNSVYAEVGMDYTEIAKRIADNGEPGLIYKDVMQTQGRIGEEMHDPGIGVNPCAEQILEHRELCTLVEVIPANHDSYEELQETLKYAYLYAKSVTLAKTHDEETNKVMARNRRIGTSQTGVVQITSQIGEAAYADWLERGYHYIQELDELYSEWLGVNRSVRTTTVKPSGTVSLLSGSTPGVHYPEFDYYIRRIRIAEGSELLKKVQQAGYFTEPDKYSANTWVVELPVKGEGLPTTRDVSVEDKAWLATFMAKHWSDNAVSCTITFSKDEAGRIADILRENEGKWKTVSFLPMTEAGAFEQMPYEAITEERYEGMIKGLQPISYYDNDSVAEQPLGDLYCTTDVCSINTFKLNAETTV